MIWIFGGFSKKNWKLIVRKREGCKKKLMCHPEILSCGWRFWTVIPAAVQNVCNFDCTYFLSLFFKISLFFKLNWWCAKLMAMMLRVWNDGLKIKFHLLLLSNLIGGLLFLIFLDFFPDFQVLLVVWSPPVFGWTLRFLPKNLWNFSTGICLGSGLWGGRKEK